MTSFEGGPVIGEGGYLHSECSTEHGGDSSHKERDGAGEPVHVVDAAVDDDGHDNHESTDDFVLCIDEGVGTLFDDGSDGDGVVMDHELLILLAT